MTLSNFLSKLNWRLMVVHFIACWFFIYAFQQLSGLHDPEIFNIVDHPRTNSDAARMIEQSFWFNISRPVGLLTAFIISIIVSLRHKCYWLNPVIVFIVTFLLLRYDLLGWDYMRPIVRLLGVFFESMAARFLVEGLVLLTIGLCLFFMKWSTRFINGNK